MGYAEEKTDQNDMGDEMISDFSAIKPWKSISQQNQDLISRNVYLCIALIAE